LYELSITNMLVCIISHGSDDVEALETFDILARKLHEKSLSEEKIKKIKLEMSRALNLISQIAMKFSPRQLVSTKRFPLRMYGLRLG
jgi:hypothetical protein